jgi:hypothetical protein
MSGGRGLVRPRDIGSRVLPGNREGGRVMTNVIDRNGISGLVLRGVVITLAAVMFGCAPKAAALEPASPAPIAGASH